MTVTNYEMQATSMCCCLGEGDGLRCNPAPNSCPIPVCTLLGLRGTKDLETEQCY
jgi:hypothetical protein